MKNIINKNKLFLLFSILSLSSCTEYIEITNKDKVSQENFYRDETEINLALTGAYSTLRAPIASEWWLTEIRSDNAMMNVYNTSNQTNLQVYANDIFLAPTNDTFIESYWATTYQSLRSINALLVGLKTTYNPTTGTIDYGASFTASVTDATRKRIAGEASFMRAYHYFQLVRLFGGVFLVDTPISTEEALNMSRASVADIYKLIIADLKNASANCISTTFAASAATDKGKVTSWAAKALLAKVYLTMGNKTDALPLLSNVITSSGYSLLTGTTGYANVFSASNELNSEILFAVRFKSGTGVTGNGSSIANLFATNTTSISTQTKLLVPPGTRGGYNNPTEELYNSYAATDIRRDYTIKVFKPTTTALVPSTWTYWAAKHNATSTITNDSELDWPVLRFSDVLLMYAEASTANATTLGYINQVHTRAGLTPLSLLTDLNTPAKYEQAIANERRWEFALENQRWFDLLRFDKTLTNINGSRAVMNNHFTAMMPFYIQYPDALVDPVLPTVGTEQLKVLKTNVANAKFDLLPIPNLEITTNTTKQITQNPGY